MYTDDFIVLYKPLNRDFYLQVEDVTLQITISLTRVLFQELRNNHSRC